MEEDKEKIFKIVFTVNESENENQPEETQANENNKKEMSSILEWIKNPEGLSRYISYYLQQNDQKKISELALIYNTLHRICKS